MKQLVLLLITSLSISVFCVSTASAQRNSSTDKFESKAAAKASQTATATTTQEYRGASAQMAPTTSLSSSPQAAYRQLLGRQNVLSQQLNELSASLSSLRRGQAKKVLKQIDILKAEQKSIATQIDMFPRAIKDPAYAKQLEEQQKNEFKQQLTVETNAAIAKSDPYFGAMSSDPELQRAYKEYLGKEYSYKQSGEQTAQNSKDLTFRVMFAITKKPLNTKSLGLSPVVIQKLSNGNTAYYYGSFATKEKAQAACNTILAEGKYRDAFVVAMVGNTRVSVPQ